MEHNKIFQIFKQYGLGAALLAILIFFASVMIEKTTNIQTSIVNIQMKLVEIQNKMVDEEKVQRIVNKAIENHEKIYHRVDKQ